MIKNKVALVTGSSKGIGYASALRLAKEGAKVVVNYNHSEELAFGVVEEINRNGGQAMAIKADVSDMESAGAMFEKIGESFGVVDILVNNAGITMDRSIKNMTLQEFDKTINTNLKGTFICSKLASSGMIEKGYGKIINISSASAYNGAFGQANYAASKAGIDGFTRVCATEWGAKGIRVNSIAPGFIITDMTENLTAARKQSAIDVTLLKYLGSVEDIAGVVYFLSCRDSDYITGQVVHVNAGKYLA